MSSWLPWAGFSGTTRHPFTATAATSRPPSSKQPSMLHNTPTNWLESNNPSLYQSQGDSVWVASRFFSLSRLTPVPSCQVFLISGNL